MNNAVPGWVLMPFGKHHKKPLASVPVAYLKKILFAHRLPGWLVEQINKELGKRSER